MIEYPKRMKVAGTHVGDRRKAISKYVYRTSKFRLKREPDNMFDPNAIKVYLQFKSGGEFHLGYIPAVYAKEMAPEMDEGMEFVAKFAIRLLNENTGEAFGIVISVNREDRNNGETS